MKRPTQVALLETHLEFGTQKRVIKSIESNLRCIAQQSIHVRKVEQPEDEQTVLNQID